MAFNPCENNNGTVSVVEGNPAFTSYKNVLKNLDMAEKKLAGGSSTTALNNLKNVERYLGYVIKKEPNADLSEVCGRYNDLQKKAMGSASAKEDFAVLNYELGFFIENYKNYSVGVYEDPRFKQQKDAFVNMPKFDRTAFMEKVGEQEQLGTLSSDGKAIKQKLTNLQTTLQQYDIINSLYALLDELNNSAAIDLSIRSKRVLQIVKGFAAIGGNHPDLNELLAFAEKQLKKAEDEMAAIYTGEFHKDHVNEIIFTKKPYTPGDETNVEINPVFKTGDPVYATLYLSATLEDALTCANVPNCSAVLTVEDKTRQKLDKWYEPWEMGYHYNVMRIYENTNSAATTYQFLLFASNESDFKKDVVSRNITLAHMARGLSKQAQRSKEFNVQVSMTGVKTGVKMIKGNFKMDLSEGNSSDYYTKLDNKIIEEFIKNNTLPSKKMSNAALEAQLLGIMNGQGWAEQYTSCIIQSGWQVFTPLGRTAYRDMTAAFPYKTAEGKCGYQTYTFRALKSGSGWAAPQKSGGALVRERVTCDKVNSNMNNDDRLKKNYQRRTRCKG